MKHIATAVMIAAFAGSAQAQKLTPQQMIDAAKQAEQADVERRYDAQIKRQKSQAAPEAKPDPWGNVRTVTPPSRDKR